jgi:hypothetical protein
MKKRILTEWYKGVQDEKARKERADEIFSAAPTLRLLKQLLEDRLRTLEETHTNKTKYDSPSWPYLQADYVGEKRSLQSLIQLVTIEE